MVVLSPAEDPAIAVERAGVPFGSANLGIAAGPRRIRLLVVVIAPTDDPAIGFQRAGVIHTRADLGKNALRRGRFSVAVVPPAGEAAVEPDRAGEMIARAELQVRLVRVSGRSPIYVISPAFDLSGRIYAANMGTAGADLREWACY